MDITALGGQVLYSAEAASFKELLETAVAQNIVLEHADLRGHDLRHANLDGAKLPHAFFDHSDLTGANLSEANLNAASFENTILYDTCFCESQMPHASFCRARFGNTDFAYATLTHCLFEGPEIGNANLMDTHTMEGSLFLWDGVPLPMSKPPQTMRSAHSRLICLDHHAIINYKLIDSRGLKSIQKLLRLMYGVLRQYA